MLGQYDHTIDAKGRIIIPAKFREQMGDDFVITNNLTTDFFINWCWSATILTV